MSDTIGSSFTHRDEAANKVIHAMDIDNVVNDDKRHLMGSNFNGSSLSNSAGGASISMASARTWIFAVLEPVANLNRLQRQILFGTTAGAFVLTTITRAIIDSPAVNLGDSVFLGQLVGFFMVFYAWILAFAMRDKPMAFENDTRSAVNAAAEFGLYMIIFFVADRTPLLPRAEKRKDEEFFWIVCGLVLAAALLTIRKAKIPATQTAAASPAALEEASGGVAVSNNTATFHVKHLQRDQTEEWKGWMQVMFLLYHYFNATSIYNVIRLYIAAYVWMTGFGNFSYYYIKKDFSVSRFVAMQWRLNFMVTWVCAILGNEYMLYYICPLHTIFTLFIYFGLGIRHQLNYTQWGLVAKFVALFAIAVVMWDVKGVFELVWSPFKFLVQYNNPCFPTRNPLSEWQFRSGLDHLVWLVGMFMAYNHPRFDSWLERLDALPAIKSNAIKGAVVAGVVVCGYIYYDRVFTRHKKEYNKVHPYTSFIPIILFIILRNIFTVARQYHLHLFTFLGKTTLETYIAQFHIWMGTRGTNTNPKELIRILPEEWFITNFVLISVLFFCVSYRLFQCTNAIRPLLIPAKASDDFVKRNVVLGLVLIFCVRLLASVMDKFGLYIAVAMWQTSVTV